MKLRNLTASPYEVVLADNTTAIVPAFGVSEEIELRDDFLASLNMHAWQIVGDEEDVVDGGDDDTIVGNDGDDDQVVDAGDGTGAGSDDSTVAGDAGDDTVGGGDDDTVAGDAAGTVADAGEIVDVSKSSKKEVIALLDKHNIFYKPEMDLRELRAAYNNFMGK